MPNRPPDTGKRSAGWQATAFAGLAYLALSITLSWPLVLHLDTTLFGDYGDTRGWGWWIWAKTHGWYDGAVNPLLSAPFGIPTGGVVRQPISDHLVLALARATNEIAAMNLFVLLAFPATALGTFVLINRLLGSPLPAFFAGAVYGFCPAAVMQATGGHAAFALNLFIPLFLLALFYNREVRTLGSASCVAAAYAGITFTALYFGYFAIFIALYFVIFDVWRRDSLHRERIFTNYLACAAIAACIVLPVELPALLEQLQAPREALARAGHIRNFDELTTYSSRPWNYLVPSIDHPLFPSAMESVVRRNLGGSNVFEQTLYLGAIPLGLLGAGIFFLARGTMDRDLTVPFAFFAIGAAFMYFLSLPPNIGFVPTASYLGHEIAPMFRVYARVGILVNLFVACASAVALTSLARRRSRAGGTAAVLLLVGMLAVEYRSIPWGHAHDVAPPEVYRWLATQGGEFTIAEYPMVNADEAAFYSYPFWQRIHGKRLLNGASPGNPKAWALFERVNELGKPGVPGLLKAAGVRYVLVHENMYLDGPIPAPIKRYYPPERAELTFNGGEPPGIPPALRLVRSFGKDKVYRIE